MTDGMTVSEDVARAQLQSFLDYYDLEPEVVPDSARESFDVSCQRIIRAIHMGRLEIKEEDGITLTQTLKHPPGESSTITFGVLKGHSKVAMKGRSDKDHYGRMYALLGSLSGLGEQAIQALQGADLSLSECIGMLFMQV